jgi:hypothetical protein
MTSSTQPPASDASKTKTQKIVSNKAGDKAVIVLIANRLQFSKRGNCCKFYFLLFQHSLAMKPRISATIQNGFDKNGFRFFCIINRIRKPFLKAGGDCRKLSGEFRHAKSVNQCLRKVIQGNSRPNLLLDPPKIESHPPNRRVLTAG